MSTRTDATPLSILDLVTYAEGTPLADAFRNSRKLAQCAERWGYRRIRASWPSWG